MVNFPVFFTSVVASVANSSRILEHSAFPTPLFPAKASAMPVFGRDLADFMAPFFMPFIAAIAFIAFIAFPKKIEGKKTRRTTFLFTFEP